MGRTITKARFRSSLLCASAFLLPAAAHGACSNNAPASSSSVVCPGADTTGVIAAASDHVSLDVQNGASIVPLSGPAIWLGPSANVTIEQGAIVGNQALANNYAVLLGNLSTLTLDGAITSPGGITGPTQGSGSTGLTGAHITLGATGSITTSGIFSTSAINGRGGSNTYTINGLIDVASQGISVGTGDVVTIGATGIVRTQAVGTSANPIDGFSVANVTVNTQAGSQITLHGLGRGIQLGANANVTVGGAITSLGDSAILNSSGGVGVEVGPNSTVHLLSTGSIVTGNAGNVGNGGTGGIGISTFNNAGSNSTIIVDGLIDTQKAQGIFAGTGDSITIGQSGKITTRGSNRGIFVRGYTTSGSDHVTLNIAGRIENLGTANAITLQADNIGATRVDLVANVTVAETGSLFTQNGIVYATTAGDTQYPDVIDNLIVAGRVERGTPGTAISLGTGADTITLLPTAVIAGNIDGGSSTGSLHPGDVDTFVLAGASGTTGTFDFSVNQLLNFEMGRKSGAGTWIMQGNSGSGISSLFAVDAGTLKVNGTLSNGGASVASGAVLTGTGSIGGTTTIANGATLSGTAGQTLTLNNLSLSNASLIDVTLGAPSATGLFHATGNLTLDGQLAVHSAPSFGFGVYRLFDYDGVLTDNGLTVSSLPSGYAGQVQTSVANQINLVVSNDIIPDIQFWNGTTTTAAGHVVGGNGIWNAGVQTNWTNAPGARADAWNAKLAIFQGPPDAASGTVTVNASNGAVNTTGMQFIGCLLYTSRCV